MEQSLAGARAWPALPVAPRWSAGWGKMSEYLSAATLLVVVLLLCFGHSRGAGRFDSTTLGDYTYNFEMSQRAAAQGSYDGLQFPYPPPGVWFRLALAKGGFLFGAGLWIFLLVASVGVTFYWLIDFLPGASPYRWRLALTAFLLVRYYLEWDLKALNCNFLYLALVVGTWRFHSTRPTWAGTLLALSIALKLYSGLFLFYYVWRRQWRVVGSTVVVCLFLFVLLPAFAFGPSEALALTRSWWRQIQQTSDPNFPFVFHAYLISVPKTLLVLLTERVPGISPEWAWSEEAVYGLTRSLQALWVMLFFASFAFARTAPDDHWTTVAWGSSLLLAPLPFSPLLQPHHLVVTLPPTLLMLYAVLDATYSTRARIGWALVLVLGLFILEAGPAGTARGVGVLCHLYLLQGSILTLVSHRRDVQRGVDGSLSSS